MKTKKRGPGFQAHQGDVLVMGISRCFPIGKRVSSEDGHTVLAHGEVTGHSHKLVAGPAVSLYRDDFSNLSPENMRVLALGGGLPGDRLLVTREEVPIIHEEHGPIPLGIGQVIVRVQKQYRPSRRIAVVAD